MLVYVIIGVAILIIAIIIIACSCRKKKQMPIRSQRIPGDSLNVSPRTAAEYAKQDNLVLMKGTSEMEPTAIALENTA